MKRKSQRRCNCLGCGRGSGAANVDLITHTRSDHSTTTPGVSSNNDQANNKVIRGTISFAEKLRELDGTHHRVDEREPRNERGREQEKAKCVCVYVSIATPVK